MVVIQKNPALPEELTWLGRAGTAVLLHDEGADGVAFDELVAQVVDQALDLLIDDARGVWRQTDRAMLVADDVEARASERSGEDAGMRVRPLDGTGAFR
jgi:hypothetical protein